MTTGLIHAAVLHGLGETPRYESFPAPVARDGEAVVRVAAAALKPADRLMASGVHYAPGGFPHVAGLDGVGWLDDGTRVAFFMPERPYGGMAEQTLVRRGAWFPVPDSADDVIAAAVLNPGMAAWKSVVWEGEVVAGQTVLVLGATGTSGRIAMQLAARRGARVVAAGRNHRVLDRLTAEGADAVIDLDQSGAELVEAFVVEGPYDLVIDYVWGGPAEAAFAAFTQPGVHLVPARTRYLLVGMAAGGSARVPAMALRVTPVQLTGSGFGGPPPPEASASAYGDLLGQLATGELAVDIDRVPLADVERVWSRDGNDRRTVFVP
jgi:NADPH:quinone reductase-like Zn-dependent oxidoreductase